MVEYLGNEELIHVSAGDADIVAVIGSEHRVRPGDQLTLQVPLDKVHLFDAETGLSLRRSVQEHISATGAAPVAVPESVAVPAAVSAAPAAPVTPPPTA